MIGTDELSAELEKAGFHLRADGIYCGDTLVMDRPVLERNLVAGPTISAIIRKVSGIWNYFDAIRDL